MEKTSRKEQALLRAADAACALGSWALQRGRADDPKRITVLAFWGIGDATHLTPLLGAMRGRFPKATIEVIGKPFLRDVFLHDPDVDEVTVYAPPWARDKRKYQVLGAAYRRLWCWLARRRRRENDWIVTTRGDIREHIFAAAMGGRRRFGFGRGGGRTLLTDSFPLPAPILAWDRHFVEYNHATAGFLGCQVTRPEPRLALLDEEREAAHRFLRGTGWRGQRPLVGVHVGSNFAIRRWPVGRFAAALRQARKAIGWLAIFCDPEDQWRRLEPPRGLGTSVFEGGLRRLFGVASHLDAMVSNDCGIMHVAASLGVRAVAVFGPTSPITQAPRGPGHRVVVSDEVSCGPCLDHQCRLGGPPRCIESITPAQVAEALLEVLADGTRKNAQPRPIRTRTVRMAGGVRHSPVEGAA